MPRGGAWGDGPADTADASATTVMEVTSAATDAIGGGAVTGTVHPGFRAPTLTHEVLLQACGML